MLVERSLAERSQREEKGKNSIGQIVQISGRRVSRGQQIYHTAFDAKSSAQWTLRIKGEIQQIARPTASKHDLWGMK